MIISKQDYVLSTYEREGFDFKVGILKCDDMSCNIFYLEDGIYSCIGGLKRNDGKPLSEEEDILPHIALLFGDE